MRTVGIRDLKQNASAVVAEMVTGETVQITSRGRAVAHLVPLPSSRLSALVAAGRARPARRTISSLGEVPAGGVGGQVLSEVLRDQRNAERY